MRMVVVVRSWAVSKAKAKRDFVAGAGNVIQVVEMAIALLIVLALLLVTFLLVSLAAWKLAQMLELRALSGALEDSRMFLAQGHATMV